MITVIVPFYNAQETIRPLLDGLRQQTFVEQYEVILVDNLSTDSTISIINSFQHEYPDFPLSVLEYRQQPSSYGARNKGVQHAKGDIFAFTDADCRPTARWLESIASFFTLNSNAIMSGAVELEIVDETNPWEVFDSLAHMDNLRNTSRAHIATANMAVLAKDFRDIGEFQSVLSGGDHDWSKRAKMQNFSIFFSADALVLHPTRKQMEEIEKKLIRIAKGQGQLVKMQSGGRKVAIVRFLLRTVLPARHLWYGFHVSKRIGIFRSLDFVRKYFKISLRQCIVFVHECRKSD